MEKTPETESPTIHTKKHIVVYSKHNYIVDNLRQLLEQQDYSTSGFSIFEEIYDYLRMHPFDAVVISGGVEPYDRVKIQNLIKSDFQHARMIEHYGGPATLLSEIKTALNS